MNLEEVGNEIVKNLKGESFFPYKTGNLKFNATSGRLINPDTYDICFDETIAPYITYLEEGSSEHDIPFAFIGKGNWKWWFPYGDGVPFLFGMGGRFNGKFHPGSTKHKGFISDKCVNYCIQYFIKKYRGELKWLH